MTAPGLILAAPSSGCGKTVITLALLRALRNGGVNVAAAKAGPDYIDPAYHSAACGRVCINLDVWAMRRDTLAGLAGGLGGSADLILCEGVMGLFDGASGGGGSTADLAAATGWPVVLIVNARGQGASAAALAEGFIRHRQDVEIAGIICNRVGSAGHARILREAFVTLNPAVPLLGCLPADAALELPDRHLGLVQASEHMALEPFLEAAAALMTDHIDLTRLKGIARHSGLPPAMAPVSLPPIGQRIAVARDEAFLFCYPAVLDGWRRAGAEIMPFSPLADASPDTAADAVYLPGGYPELHAGRLAGNTGFLGGLRLAAATGKAVFGECGGYMVLGSGLIDADGVRHAMAGLLPVTTSFADRRLQLGYRRLDSLYPSPLGAAGSRFTGHEFHYATIHEEGPGDALFAVRDSRNDPMSPAGRVAGNVAGSFIHLIDSAA
ncbi:MAG: cobyrinate a,c-diamide synthase [Alphaproteobacteria bacterium]